MRHCGVSLALLVGALSVTAKAQVAFSPNPPPAAETKTNPVANRSVQNAANEPQQAIKVLSDTRGVNLNPYLGKVLPKVEQQWYYRAPEVARVPIAKAGFVSIDFQVAKTGKISKVLYSKRSGDRDMVQAAYPDSAH